MASSSTHASIECKEAFHTLRFRKEKTNYALVLKIDLTLLEVVIEERNDNFTVDDLKDSLPESTPRFIVMSYEMLHRDGRVSYPLVGLYYCPEGSSTHNRMLYASSASMIFSEAQIVGKVFDLVDPEEFTENWLKGCIEKSKTRP